MSKSTVTVIDPPVPETSIIVPSPNYNYDGAESITRVGMVGSHYNYVRQDDGKYKQDSLPDPTRTGWIFLGWYDAPRRRQ